MVQTYENWEYLSPIGWQPYFVLAEPRKNDDRQGINGPFNQSTSSTTIKLHVQQFEP
jgi:hypothetical protein